MPPLSRFRVGILLVLLLLCIPEAQSQLKRMAVIGSSTSACNGLDINSQCWVGLFERYYDSAGIAGKVIRLAASGYNCYNAMPSTYLPPFNREKPDTNRNITKAINLGADVIIVNFPSNGYSYFSGKEVMNCFRAVRDSANKVGKVCYFTTTQPRNDIDFNRQSSRDSLMALRDSILNYFGNFAIDFWTGIANPDGTIKPGYDQGDHIHLNAAAHRIFFERIMQKNVFTASAALPLHNLDFQSTFKEGKVTLNWKSDPNDQVEKFQLEKSRDGKNFTTIYEVIANSAATNTFVDQKPEQGNNFYRLQVFFKSGKKDFSPVLKHLIHDGSFKIEKVYMSSPGLQIEWQSTIKQTCFFKVYNTVGSLISSSETIASPGNNQFNLRLKGNISAGTYFLIVENSMGERGIWPLMIQNQH